MTYFSDILEISKSLDDVIEKGSRLESKSSGGSLRKGLTFDPTRPYEMTSESEFYNPYRQLEGGGYMPYPVDYWREKGKTASKEPYIEVQILYDQIEFKRSQYNGQILKSMNDLFKGEVPVGTTHTYSNGVTYKKLAPGRWAPVKDTSKPMTGHADIEAHAKQVLGLKDAIKNKQKEEDSSKQSVEAARREAFNHAKEIASHIFGDELPERLKQHFDKKEAEYSMKDKDKGNTPEQKLVALDKEVKGKKHSVKVQFTHNGKQYDHEFKNVMGHSQSEISGRISDLVKKKIPGAMINKIKTEAIQEKK